MKDQWLHPQVVPFFNHLKRYAADRGALANLRGALSENRRANAWPLLGGFSSAIGNPVFEKVAGLWAAEPCSPHSNDNLGATLAKLRQDNNSFEGRFKRLLTCDKTEIVERVVPVVRAAQAKGLEVNYQRLLSDLLIWSDKVKIDWARAFWDAPVEGEEQEVVAS